MESTTTRIKKLIIILVYRIVLNKYKRGFLNEKEVNYGFGFIDNIFTTMMSDFVNAQAIGKAVSFTSGNIT